MAKHTSEFVQTVVERGFIQDCSDIDALDDLASREIVTAYIGFDCTATSLHAGSLLPIMLLRWLQQTGHQPLVLMGGGTTKVGDPSGKDESRKLLSTSQINENLTSIKNIFSKYLTFGDDPNGAIMANNADWLDKLNYIEFLRDYGAHFTINRMLKFDSVKLRLDREHPLTFLEFNYMILQAYDFLELSRRYNCRMQMGGSDQWGNIINGVELGRRVDQVSLLGLTSPLLTTASDAKMGKTAAGAVWLNEDLTSAYEFWQYWRNTEDADVGKFLRLFTELPLDEIAKLESLEGAELNEAKKILATNVTALQRELLPLHGSQFVLAYSPLQHSKDTLPLKNQTVLVVGAAGTVLVTSFNAAYFTFFANWACHVERLGLRYLAWPQDARAAGFDVREGHVASIIGSSGSGKSTLLKWSKP